MTYKIAPILSTHSSIGGSARLGLLLAINLFFLIARVIEARAGSVTPMARDLSRLSISPGQDQEKRLLEPGKPIEREIAGGESHFYRVTLAAGQYLYAVVDQRGIDLVVAAWGPDGKKLVEMDSPNNTYGLEPLRLIAAVDGEYRLVIRSTDRRVAAARYEARIEELRAATPQDDIRISAQAVFTEGMRQVVIPLSGPLSKAIEKFDIALPLFRSLGDRGGEANTLHALGYSHSKLGDNQKALYYYRLAASIRNTLGDRWGEANVLNGLGTVHTAIGETQQALDNYSRALLLLRVLNIRQGETPILNNIGSVYKLLGDLRQAAGYFNQALPLLAAEKDDKGMAITLNNLGQISSALGEPNQALEYYKRSLSLSRSIGDKRSEAGTLHNIGLVYDSQGDTSNALDCLNRSLPMLKTVGDRYNEAATLATLGHIYHSLGDREKALELLNQALPLCRATGNRQGEAFTLYHLTRIEFGGADLTQARAHMAEALEVVEALRRNVASWQLRASFLATAQEYYDLSIDLLMQSHRLNPSEKYDVAALENNERAIARSLLESLSEARADIRNGVDAELLERERALQRQLVARTEDQAKSLSGQLSALQAAAINKEIESTIAQYQEVQSQIRARSPRYAALTQPVPLKLIEIQRQTLDYDTILLEYALGKERSYLWAVTTSTITSHELPKRAEIEAVARRVYESFSIGASSAQPNKAREKASRALSQMLLGPVAGELGTRRLLIVATGALQYLPFGALPAPARVGRVDRVTGRQGDRTNPQLAKRNSQSLTPLIVDHEIVYLPSASTLAVLRHELSGRESAPRQIAVLADPVFDRNDPRVKAKAGAQDDKDRTDRTQSETKETGTGQTSFDRLRSTRKEAEEIIALTHDSENLKAVDFQASRAMATSEQLAQYRIVHFATHGELNSRNPELSGLVFSLVDEHGGPQNGFLRAHEVYNLKLGADLVTLSGCQTALGKEVRGEGLLSLTRGFMYAGAPRVVASLWRIPDMATAELMKSFYRGLLVERKTPAAALRAAQIAVRKNRRWTAPYYWAAFVLQGEWN